MQHKMKKIWPYRCFKKTNNIFNFLLTILLLLNFIQFQIHYMAEWKKQEVESRQVGKRSLRSVPHQKAQKQKTKQEAAKTHVQGERFSFATLLCDDKLLEATSVLVYSMIQYAKTKYPVTIMALPSVSESEYKLLRYCGILATFQIWSPDHRGCYTNGCGPPFPVIYIPEYHPCVSG